ncbi:amino acid transporter [uncultured Methylobacterium sp.]|uniref:amino acid transporter n=1 Tax=uncultured Methylobacterium sp. TaxID=157278 RepID=UPI0035C993C3
MLTATLLNGVAVAAIAVGGIAPFVAVVVGTSSLANALLNAGIWFSFGAVLHLAARAVLRRLIE